MKYAVNMNTVKRVVILGGGFSALSAAYYLQKAGFLVTILENTDHLGGLAHGFKAINWKNHLELFYHHIFTSDKDIKQFLDEVGYDDLKTYNVDTKSLYSYNSSFVQYGVDKPMRFLSFPFLTMFEKLRAGFTVIFCKISPFLFYFEKITSINFLIQFMGKHTYEVMWKELFRKKFGKYAENIIASFIWARIKTRSSNLMYPKDGFVSIVNYVKDYLINKGVEIHCNTSITSIDGLDSSLLIKTNRGTYMCSDILSTLPTHIFCNLFTNILPKDYIQSLKGINHLSAVNIILETKNPILKDTYWLNICEETIFPMVIVGHTNMISKSYYGNNHITYIANYVESSDKIYQYSTDELYKYYLPHIKRIFPEWKEDIVQKYSFKARFAQPVYDQYFVSNKPMHKTPHEHIFCANLDTTYPYDRGTNYAVKGGKSVANLIIKGYK